MAGVAINMYSGPVTAVEIGGEDMGGTYDGVEVTREDEFADVNLVSDQTLGEMSRNLLSRKFVVILNAAEVDITHLETALAQKSGNLDSSSLKLNDDEQGSVSLQLTVPAPTGIGTRTILFYTTTIVAGGAMAFKKDGTQCVVPITFDCLANSDGEFGCIVDAE